MTKVDFSPNVIAFEVSFPRMPSSQPGAIFVSHHEYITSEVKLTSDNTAYANLGSEVPSAD